MVFIVTQKEAFHLLHFKTNSFLFRIQYTIDSKYIKVTQWVHTTSYKLISVEYLFLFFYYSYGNNDNIRLNIVICNTLTLSLMLKRISNLSLRMSFSQTYATK